MDPRRMKQRGAMLFAVVEKDLHSGPLTCSGLEGPPRRRTWHADAVVETVSSRCARARGRRIPRDVVVRLIASGAGHCYRPECPIGFLWYALDDQSAVKLAEVAHIVAASVGGPRSNSDAPEELLTAFGNLLLLCPNCHVTVDSSPDAFTVGVLRGWKTEHERRVSGLWGIRKYEDRSSLRRDLMLLLEENYQVWAQYGPESAAANDAITDVNDAWRREVVASMLPNNERVMRLLDRNQHLLRDDEIRVVTQFRVHARAFADRHLAGRVNSSAPRFPLEMNDLLKD
jgi:hypothetical protein